MVTVHILVFLGFGLAMWLFGATIFFAIGRQAAFQIRELKHLKPHIRYQVVDRKLRSPCIYLVTNTSSGELFWFELSNHEIDSYPQDFCVEDLWPEKIRTVKLLPMKFNENEVAV